MRDNSALVDLIRVDALSHDVSHHRDMITRIIYVDMRGGSRDTFVTASRDGTLRFWSPTTMLPVRTIQHAENNKRFLSSTIDARVLDGGMTGGGIPGSDKGPPSMNAKGGSAANRHRMDALNKAKAASTAQKTSPVWITDICFMPVGSRLAVASIDRFITFYDLNSFEVACRMQYLAHTPTCLCLVSRPADENQVLCYGDSAGGLHVFELAPEFQFEPSPDKVRGGRGVLSATSKTIHSEWITRMRYIDDLELLVTCSLDSDIVFYDLNKHHKLRTFRGHSMGVRAFDWCTWRGLLLLLLLMLRCWAAAALFHHDCAAPRVLHYYYYHYYYCYATTYN